MKTTVDVESYSDVDNVYVAEAGLRGPSNNSGSCLATRPLRPAKSRQCMSDCKRHGCATDVHCQFNQINLSTCQYDKLLLTGAAPDRAFASGLLVSCGSETWVNYHHGFSLLG